MNKCATCVVLLSVLSCHLLQPSLNHPLCVACTCVCVFWCSVRRSSRRHVSLFLSLPHNYNDRKDACIFFFSIRSAFFFSPFSPQNVPRLLCSAASLRLLRPALPQLSPHPTHPLYNRPLRRHTMPLTG